MRTEIL